MLLTGYYKAEWKAAESYNIPQKAVIGGYSNKKAVYVARVIAGEGQWAGGYYNNQTGLAHYGHFGYNTEVAFQLLVMVKGTVL